jgi:hypothetical protein
VFSFGIAYFGVRGVQAATAVNMAVNAIQISALLVFSVMTGLSHESPVVKHRLSRKKY